VPEDEQVRGDPLLVVLHGLGPGRVPLDIRDPQQGNMQPREQHLQVCVCVPDSVEHSDGRMDMHKNMYSPILVASLRGYLVLTIERYA